MSLRWCSWTIATPAPKQSSVKTRHHESQVVLLDSFYSCTKTTLTICDPGSSPYPESWEVLVICRRDSRGSSRSFANSLAFEMSVLIFSSFSAKIFAFAASRKFSRGTSTSTVTVFGTVLLTTFCFVTLFLTHFVPALVTGTSLVISLYSIWVIGTFFIRFPSIGKFTKGMVHFV